MKTPAARISIHASDAISAINAIDATDLARPRPRHLERGADLAGALDALIEGGPLHVEFQPIVDLRVGRAIGYEVLGRHGALTGRLAELAHGPAALLEAAHGCDRLVALDRRWRTLAVEAISAHDDATSLYFLNVDPRIVDDPSHVSGFTKRLVDRHGLAPERFVLELTERACSAPETIHRVLEEYRACGFRVAIDDLGAPTQSLVLLLALRPHVLKLDAHLVRGIEHDPMRERLLRAFVDFADASGMQLIAEGIETEAELQAVERAGVRWGQGYLLGRPARTPTPVERRARANAPTEREDEPRDGDDDAWSRLRSLLDAMSAAPTLEAMLDEVTAFVSRLLDVERATIRLLDEARTRLLVASRSGPALHRASSSDFAIGEGLVGWIAQHGAPLRISNAADDPRFAPRPDRVAPFSAFLGVPIADSDGCFGVLATTSPNVGAFTERDEEKLRVVGAIVASQLQLARARRLALIDPLTGAWNRRALGSLVPAWRDEAAPTAVLALDIDRFKSINDSLGHPVGDDVLRALVTTIRRVVRDVDPIVRLGGDEFLIVIDDADLARATTVAERVSAALRADPLLARHQVTVSIGVAQRSLRESAEDLLARADDALYRAKAQGRDRVVTSDV